jgi:hypothetical protein
MDPDAFSAAVSRPAVHLAKKIGVRESTLANTLGDGVER